MGNPTRNHEACQSHYLHHNILNLIANRLEGILWGDGNNLKLCQTDRF